LSRQSHRRRAWSLLPFAQVEVHQLALAKVSEGDALDLGMMKEQVGSSGLDKPETAIRNQPLYLTLWHCCLPRRHAATPLLTARNSRCSQTNQQQIAVINDGLAKKGRSAQLCGPGRKNDRFGVQTNRIFALLRN
jgi:hypothetical protein